MASSLRPRSGAKPPSSPTAVARPALVQQLLQRVEDLGAHAQRPRRSVGAPTGMTMNSCRSSVLSACAPPLMTFIIGTGSSGRPRRRGSGRAASSRSPAAALRDRQRDAEDGVGAEAALVRRAVELEQRGVERALVERVHAQQARGAISSLTFATAFVTPLPPHASSAVAQLDGLVCAGRGARRHRRAPERAGLELDLHLDRRVSRGSPGSAGRARSRSRSWAAVSPPGLAWRVDSSRPARPARAARKSRPSAAARASAPSTRAAEAGARRAQRELRIDAREAQHVDGREQQVAGLVADHPVARAVAVQHVAQLGELSSSSERPRPRRHDAQSKPIAAARRCTLRACSSAGSVAGTSWKMPSRPSSLALDRPPRLRSTAPSCPRSPRRTRAGAGGRASRGCRRRRRPGRRRRLAGQQRQEVRLEQQVAQLVDELRPRRAGQRGVGDLVGLLDRVRHDRLGGLLAVPGTVAPQPRRHRPQLRQRRRRRAALEGRAGRQRAQRRVGRGQAPGLAVGRGDGGRAGVVLHARGVEHAPDRLRRAHGHRPAVTTAAIAPTGIVSGSPGPRAHHEPSRRSLPRGVGAGPESAPAWTSAPPVESSDDDASSVVVASSVEAVSVQAVSVAPGRPSTPPWCLGQRAAGVGLRRQAVARREHGLALVVGQRS